MGPKPAPPPEDGVYADIRHERNYGELAIFDQVIAQPLDRDERNALSLEGALPFGTRSGRGTFWITVWRGVRNGRAPSSAADRLWVLIASPDREGRVPYLPQIIHEEQPGYGVLLLEEEDEGGRIDRGVHALVEALKLIEPGQRRLRSLQKAWGYNDLNDALEGGY